MCIISLGGFRTLHNYAKCSYFALLVKSKFSLIEACSLLNLYYALSYTENCLQILQNKYMIHCSKGWFQAKSSISEACYLVSKYQKFRYMNHQFYIRLFLGLKNTEVKPNAFSYNFSLSLSATVLKRNWITALTTESGKASKTKLVVIITTYVRSHVVCVRMCVHTRLSGGSECVQSYIY